MAPKDSAMGHAKNQGVGQGGFIRFFLTSPVAVAGRIPAGQAGAPVGEKWMRKQETLTFSAQRRAE